MVWIAERAELARETLADQLLDAPQTTGLLHERTAMTELRKPRLPVSREVDPEFLVVMVPEKLAHDFHHDHVHIAQTGRRTSRPKAHIADDRAVQIVHHAVDNDHELLQTHHEGGLLVEGFSTHQDKAALARLHPPSTTPRNHWGFRKSKLAHRVAVGGL